MKSKIILIFLSIGLQASAQYDSEGENTSRFRPGLFWYFTGYRPAIPGKVRKYDRLIFDLTYSDWTGDRKPFKVHLGGRIGIESNFYGKLKSSSGGKATRLTLPDYNRLTYGAYVRVGIRNWSILGSYSFNPLFSNANSTKLNMIQLGLSVSVF